MKEKLRNKRNAKIEKGITLVALVVTIVVLLILAGVTIVTLFGEDGIITKAQKAKKQTESGTSTELAGMEELLKKMNQAIGGKVEEVPEVLKKYMLGDEQKGRPVDEILELIGTDLTDLNNIKFKANKTIPDANEKIKATEIDEASMSLLIMYESKSYIVTIEPLSGDRYTLPFKTVEITIVASLEPIYDGYTKKDQVNGEEGIACYAPGLLSKMNPYNLCTYVIENEGTTLTFTGFFASFVAPFVDKLESGAILVDQTSNTAQVIMFTEDHFACYDSSGEPIFKKEGIRVKIYDAGPRTDLAFEGDFIAWFNDSNGKWELAKAPSESYEVPHTVNGKAIEGVILDCCYASEIIINEPIVLGCWDAFPVIDKIILKTQDVDWFFTSVASLNYINNLDLSQCGDNITIPEDILEGGNLGKIYVSPEVKAKYPDNDKIVAK